MDSAAAPLAVPLFMLGGPAGIAAAMALGLTSNKYRSARRERAMEVQDRVKQRVSALPKPLEMQPQFIPGQPGQQDFVRDTSGNLVPTGTTAPELTETQKQEQQLSTAAKLADIQAKLATAAASAATAEEKQRILRIQQQLASGEMKLQPWQEFDPIKLEIKNKVGAITPEYITTKYSDAIKPLQVQSRAAAQMLTGLAQGTGVGDIQTLYSFIKALDPGSTVREGEIELTASATPLAQQIVGLAKQFTDPNNKQLLRQGFKDSLRALIEANLQDYTVQQAELDDQWGRIAQSGGIDFSPIKVDVLGNLNKKLATMPKGEASSQQKAQSDARIDAVLNPSRRPGKE
jgi:hypothetical protein